MPRLHWMEFNIESGDYRQLIQRLRQLLRQQPGATDCHQRPVLPARYDGVQPELNSLNWIELVLSTNHHTITIWIRCDNVYIMGYRSEHGRWFEFGENDGRTPRLIPGSTFLGFGGNYDTLGAIRGADILDMRISQPRVLDAVNFLARDDNSNTTNRASRLVVLIVVLCEATRFDYLFDMFVGPLQNNGEAIIVEWITKLIKCWGYLSRRMLQVNPDIRLPEGHPLSSRITNTFQAASYVGLLLGPVISSADQRFGVSASITSTDHYNGLVPKGQPLVEVFSIKNLSYSGKFQVSVVIEDGLGIQCLLDANLSLSKGDYISFNNQKRAVSACQFARVIYSLWSTDPNKYPMSVCGYKEWSIFKNRWVSVGICDGVEVDCKIFPSAWQVRWSVKVLQGNDKLNVYGHVRISYWYDNKYHRVTLFERTWDDNVEITRYKPLPLSKTLTAVPLDVDVEVDADLTDFVRFFPDHQLVKTKSTHRFGSGEFGKAKSGIFAFVDSSRVKINVEWNRFSEEPNNPIINRNGRDYIVYR